jgi:hypothetical protein
MSETADRIVPLRVVPPPTVTGILGKDGHMPVAAGARTKRALLEPLTMREQVLVCAVADALGALRVRAEMEAPEPTPGIIGFPLLPNEKQALLGLLVAFKDTTGCAWTDAEWN